MDTLNNGIFFVISLSVVQGSVYAWGYGKACGSKTDILSPSCVYSSTEQNKVVDMAGGDSHSQILLSSGAVYSWGNNFEVIVLSDMLISTVPREPYVFIQS